MKQGVGVIATCCDAYDATHAAGVKFAQKLIGRYGADYGGFSDASGNRRKMIQAKD
ncbi:MAG TPA: hypothetical protein VFL64_07310 [Rhizobacter sp.]|nr:hypothetical protein [Rhizobacter sp.]